MNINRTAVNWGLCSVTGARVATEHSIAGVKACHNTSIITSRQHSERSPKMYYAAGCWLLTADPYRVIIECSVLLLIASGLSPALLLRVRTVQPPTTPSRSITSLDEFWARIPNTPFD